MTNHSTSIWSVTAPVATSPARKDRATAEEIETTWNIPKVGIVSIGGIGGACLSRAGHRIQNLLYLDRIIAIETSSRELSFLSADHKILLGDGKTPFNPNDADRLTQFARPEMADAFAGLDMVLFVAGIHPGQRYSGRLRHSVTHPCEQLLNQIKGAKTMTPKARTNVVYIQQWGRNNILRLRRAALHLQDAANELPAELGELHVAVAECLQSSNRLQQAVEDTLDSDELAKFAIPHVELTEAEESQLLALNRHLRGVTRHLRTVVDDVKPRLEAKLADPCDPMYDYEIEARIDYQLREDDPEFAEDDDNYLSTRIEPLKSSLYGWEREDCAHLYLPAGLLAEPHCSLFKDLYSINYGAESPRLSFKDCLRIGRIFVDVQIRQQYEFNAHDGAFTKTSNPTSSWSKKLQQQTREVIKETPITPDGRLHFKHPELGYAYAKVEELSHIRLCLYRKPGGEPFWLDGVDDLLQAGWAID